jgi:pyridoxamine 5'-phosphate oxidase
MEEADWRQMSDITERTTPGLCLSLADLREDYRRGGLDERNCDSNPIAQFEAWLKEAQAADLKEPNAMTLATATPQGRPSARVVLLKEVSEAGFVFYTNYGSRKGEELKTNPFAALSFYWTELERQVRVEGRVEIVDREISEKYFRSRPKGSRLGAWVSHQSKAVNSRAVIEARLKTLEAEYPGDDVPLPPDWGGYRVVPETIEFWQGRPNRLHDRLLYKRNSENDWTLERLWP